MHTFNDGLCSHRKSTFKGYHGGEAFFVHPKQDAIVSRCPSSKLPKHPSEYIFFRLLNIELVDAMPI